MAAFTDYEFHPIIKRYLERQKALRAEETFKTRQSDLKMFSEWLDESGHELLELDWMTLEEYSVLHKPFPAEDV